MSRGNRPAHLQAHVFFSLFVYAFVVSLSALGVGHKRDSRAIKCLRVHWGVECRGIPALTLFDSKFP